MQTYPPLSGTHLWKSDDELKKFLQNYLLYGIAFVDNVPPTVEATEAVAQRVGLIRIQVFHCLKHEGTGGMTVLVDGFYAAERVRSPESLELLSRLPIRHAFIETTGKASALCSTSILGTLPNPVAFIDNWHVMHGREFFTGLRQLCGCYLTRDDVLSSARCFGLQA